MKWCKHRNVCRQDLGRSLLSRPSSVSIGIQTTAARPRENSGQPLRLELLQSSAERREAAGGEAAAAAASARPTAASIRSAAQQFLRLRSDAATHHRAGISTLHLTLSLKPSPSIANAPGHRLQPNATVVVVMAAVAPIFDADLSSPCSSSEDGMQPQPAHGLSIHISDSSLLPSSSSFSSSSAPSLASVVLLLLSLPLHLPSAVPHRLQLLDSPLPPPLLSAPAPALDVRGERAGVVSLPQSDLHL